MTVVPLGTQLTLAHGRLRMRISRFCVMTGVTVVRRWTPVALAQPRLVTDGDVHGGRYVSGVVDIYVGTGPAR